MGTIGANRPGPVGEAVDSRPAQTACRPADCREAILGADRLLAGADRLSRAASAAAGASPPRLASIVQGVLDFLVREAVPRLGAEREVLYPVLQRALSRADATAALEVEQARLRIQTERLEPLAERLRGLSVGRPEREALERILTDLSGLLRDHRDGLTTLCAEAASAQPDLLADRADWEALTRALAEAERRALGAVTLVVQPAVGSQAAVVMRHNPAASRAHAVTLADLPPFADPGQDRVETGSPDRDIPGGSRSIPAAGDGPGDGSLTPAGRTGPARRVPSPGAPT